MVNNILTKVQKQTLAFKDQINLKKQPTSKELISFVNFMHNKPKDKIIINDSSIEAFTAKKSFTYFDYSTYFKRIDADSGKIVFFKKS